MPLIAVILVFDSAAVRLELAATGTDVAQNGRPAAAMTEQSARRNNFGRQTSRRNSVPMRQVEIRRTNATARTQYNSLRSTISVTTTRRSMQAVGNEILAQTRREIAWESYFLLRWKLKLAHIVAKLPGFFDHLLQFGF